MFNDFCSVISATGAACIGRIHVILSQISFEFLFSFTPFKSLTPSLDLLQLRAEIQNNITTLHIMDISGPGKIVRHTGFLYLDYLMN
jgi:hypothetical protein